MSGPSRRHSLTTSVLLGTLISGSVIASSAVGEDAPNLRDLVRGIISARSTIESYAVSIHAEVDDPALPVQLTDGSTFTPTRKLVGYKLDIVVDTKRDRLLVARQDEFEDLTTKARTKTDWHVFATTADGNLLARDGKGILVTNSRSIEKPSYFDPLALGIAFETEFRNGGAWRKVTDNYLAWPESGPKTTAENGIVRYASGDLQIEFDPRRGYWPVRMSHTWTSAGQRTFETDLTLKQVAGHWFPALSKLKLSDGSVARLTFDWSSVNEPVASRFDMKAIQNQYAISALQ